MKVLVSAKNYVARHKAAIAFGVASTVLIVIQARANAEHNKFLVEKGLFEEFYGFPKV